MTALMASVSPAEKIFPASASRRALSQLFALTAKSARKPKRKLEESKKRRIVSRIRRPDADAGFIMGAFWLNL
jgi:hypothetical protein